MQDCPTCGYWTCPYCGANNPFSTSDTETGDDWNSCLPWDGEEASLPVGEQTRMPNFQAKKLVKAWEVLDASEDAGFRTVKTSELKPTDDIVGAVINENSFNKAVETYGKRFFLARHANSLLWYDRWAWKETYGTDVLEFEALKQIRSEKKVHEVGEH